MMSGGKGRTAVSTGAAELGLTKKEIKQCRKAFAFYDKNGSGSIDARELKAVLSSLGQEVSDEAVKKMIAEVDTDGSKEVEFQEFLQVIAAQKVEVPADSDTREAFHALGGNWDATGVIAIPKLKATLEMFGLEVDVDGLVRQLDRDENGSIEYSEFSRLFVDEDPGPAQDY